MDAIARHQCMIYSGSPAQQLPVLASIIVEKISSNHRCLYLNSPPMVAGIRSYLFAAGVDLEARLADGSLVLSSDQSHLVDGQFDGEKMIDLLMSAMQAAQRDGYAGLWASGDMSWEFGSERNFGKLFHYECRLEELLREYVGLYGVCQYHIESLPPEVVKTALYTHQAVYLNETMSRSNCYFGQMDQRAPQNGLTDMLERVRAGFLPDA